MSACACTNSHDSPYIFAFFLPTLITIHPRACTLPIPYSFHFSDIPSHVYDFSSLRASQLVCQKGTVLARSHPFCGVFWRASEVIPSFSP